LEYAFIFFVFVIPAEARRAISIAGWVNSLRGVLAAFPLLRAFATLDLPSRAARVQVERMIDGIRLKVCGLTTFVDAELADNAGADYLGFNLYPKSPRYVDLRRFRGMTRRLPARPRVAISVEPSLDELGAMDDAGFDYFQVHFRHDFPREQIAAWSKRVGMARLWLAPKLPPEIDVGADLLTLGKYIILDAYTKDVFGGSGQTGDWAKFARHDRAHRTHLWVLAGGLNPENIGDALRATDARFVDVNSGIESAPGVKDPEKTKAFVAAVRAARAAAKSSR
jgi:phosphoribosylanthranilate isomerase